MYPKNSFGRQPGSERPRIRPEKEPIDVLLEIAGLVAVIVMVMITARSYSGLPDRIPTHFNGSGQPDGYGGKVTIWLLPGITIAMYAGLSLINRFPYIFNFPVNITEENAPRLYRHATRSIRILNLLLVMLFLYLTWETIALASGKSSGLGFLFTPVAIFVILIFLLYMIVRMYKLK